MHRRDFLKGTTALAAGLATGGGAFEALAQAACHHPVED